MTSVYASTRNSSVVIIDQRIVAQHDSVVKMRNESKRRKSHGAPYNSDVETFQDEIVNIHYFGRLPQVPGMIFAAVTAYKEAEFGEEGEEFNKKTYISGFSVMESMPIEPYHQRDVIFINVANITRNVVHMACAVPEATLKMIAIMIDDRASVDKARLEVNVPLTTPQNRQRLQRE